MSQKKSTVEWDGHPSFCSKNKIKPLQQSDSTMLSCNSSREGPSFLKFGGGVRFWKKEGAQFGGGDDSPLRRPSRASMVPCSHGANTAPSSTTCERGRGGPTLPQREGGGHNPTRWRGPCKHYLFKYINNPQKFLAKNALKTLKTPKGQKKHSFWKEKNGLSVILLERAQFFFHFLG